ncbi:MAG: IS256 family transposase, partial [Actinobacteria bacterium]|nr:IS256 family transposase [Actinomycetota bacterium]
MLCRRRHKGHKTANVLSALPKRCHADAKTALAKIYTAETRAAAIDAAAAFAERFSSYPKATAKITDDPDVL